MMPLGCIYGQLTSLRASRDQAPPTLHTVSSTVGLTCLVSRPCIQADITCKRQRVRSADRLPAASCSSADQQRCIQSARVATSTGSCHQCQALAAELQPQHAAMLQSHDWWNCKLIASRLLGSVLAAALLGLALPGRRSAAVAATMPPPIPWSIHMVHDSNSTSSNITHSIDHQASTSPASGSSSTLTADTTTTTTTTSGRPGWSNTTAESPYNSSIGNPTSSSGHGSTPADQSTSSSSGSSNAAADLDDLLAYERATVNLFAAARQSVVNITHLRAMQNFYTLDIHRMAVGQGSGFIWDKYGHVITNYHVIKGAAEVKVTLFDHSSCTARVVGYDASKDIAVLKLALPRGRLDGLPPVTLGSSSSLKIGQSVFAIGNPFGLDHTLTQGIVSGLGREVSAGLSAIKGVIQTDAAINPGNSGGVLLNSKGAVIGVSLGILDPGGKGSFSGVGFAIPIDTVKGLVDQILQFGRVRRPSLGITIAPEQVLDQLGTAGVLVLEVPAGTPAAAAGLRATYRDVFGDIVLGDVIVGLDTRPIRSVADLVAALDERRPGDKVRCDVLRDGKRLSMTVTLGERGGYCE